MFGCCGVTDDKIHFGVPVSKKQNMLYLRLSVCLRSPLPGSNSEPCACRAVSSDSSHHPVQLVCAQIVLNIYYCNKTALCKSNISGGYAPRISWQVRLLAASVGSGLDTKIARFSINLTWHLWDNHVEFRNRMVHEVLMHVSLHLDEKLLGCGITKTRKINN